MFPWHEFIGLVPSSLLSLWREQMPWLITANAQKIVENILSKSGSDFVRRGSISVHRTATIENRAVIKGPAIIGARCLIATGSYLRGGVWSDEDCIIGPGTELKSSFVFRRSKLAHFNFVGDCIVGSDVNLEAGSIIANYRNERTDKQIRIRNGTELLATGVEKFGAVLGDRSRIGANAVIAPGALIKPGQVVPRVSLLDQELE
jgi:UDP-N-acetylglucosamine diphosphorylase / glucose-1-phosphate thymidylyltransferase / UDP-N-acetylgalactosamine diphosphorylase / glucosamine-1-phosphate N-acetyltransferase / galactosamine-1-phosphate N-acetyltransferase